MLFTRSKNIDPSRIYHIFKIAEYIQLPCAARFSRNYLKILNFDTKNLSPTFFELETSDSSILSVTVTRIKYITVSII